MDGGSILRVAIPPVTNGNPIRKPHVLYSTIELEAATICHRGVYIKAVYIFKPKPKPKPPPPRPGGALSL